jgi:hypothetical protein
VIIYNLYFVSVLALPTKTNAPSVIDSDAMLPGTITDELFQPVPGCGLQIIQGFSRIEEQQLPQSPSLNIGRQAPRALAPKHLLRLTISKVAYHGNILTRLVNIVKRYYPALVTLTPYRQFCVSQIRPRMLVE